jgi:hypothetical protein
MAYENNQSNYAGSSDDDVRRGIRGFVGDAGLEDVLLGG